MKCPKCGSEVKPNYKFCTKCGQPMTAEETVPESKTTFEENGSTVPEEKLLGIHLGRNEESKTRNRSSEQKEEDEAPALVENATNDINLVRGKAVWSIGPGQLARRVSESEFAQLDKVKGVVIQEGVTAVITVDGTMMGMLSGGYYEFATKEVKEKAKEKADEEEKEDKETERFLQRAGHTARRVWRFLTGTKDKEKAEVRKKRKERVKKNIQKITANSTVNVTLISTRIFELLFGSEIDKQGNAEFVPMMIKAKVVDLEIGVSLQMQITNVNDFLVNNLSDRNTFSVADAQRMIQPSIERLLGRMLRNLDYQADGLPEELVEVIKNLLVILSMNVCMDLRLSRCLTLQINLKTLIDSVLWSTNSLHRSRNLVFCIVQVNSETVWQKKPIVRLWTRQRMRKICVMPSAISIVMDYSMMTKWRPSFSY